MGTNIVQWENAHVCGRRMHLVLHARPQHECSSVPLADGLLEWHAARRARLSAVRNADELFGSSLLRGKHALALRRSRARCCALEVCPVGVLMFGGVCDVARL